MRTKMRNLMPKWVYVGAIALACFANSAAAEITMKLTGPPPGPSMGGIYTSPYTATIDPDGSGPLAGVSTFVICDDFDTDVSISTPAWKVTATKVSDLPGTAGSVKFATGYDQLGVSLTAFNGVSGQTRAYVAAAYLATQIMGAANDYEKGLLSYALWGLFYTPAFTESPIALTAAQRNGAKTKLSDAISATLGQSASAYSNVYIYTPDPLGASQEYLVVKMAEPPSLAVLSLDLLAVAGLVLFVRRRTTQTSRLLS